LGARYVLSIGNVVSSLIVGAVAFGYFWIYLPEVMLYPFRWAASLREGLLLMNWPPHYDIAIRFFIDERQIVFLGFVLMSRVVLGFLLMLGARIFGRRSEPDTWA
jgi:hypothetical protein